MYGVVESVGQAVCLGNCSLGEIVYGDVRQKSRIIFRGVFVKWPFSAPIL